MPHGGAWCYTMPRAFPAPPIFSGKSPGDEVLRARVYVRVFTRAFLILWPFTQACVTCNTVTCEARQKFGPFIVHGVKT